MIINNNIIKKYIGIILLFIGFLGFLSVWFLLPHKSEIDNIFQFSFKIFIYVILCLCVAFFPNNLKHFYLFIIALIIIFLLFIQPKLAYIGFFLLPAKGYDVFGEYYTYLYLILFNYISLIAAFAYRIGTGSPGNTFKIAISGQIVMLSGLYDIMVYLRNGMPFPDILNYTYHMKIFIGHFPSLIETIIFALFHLPIFLFVTLAPFDRWIKRLGLNID